METTGAICVAAAVARIVSWTRIIVAGTPVGPAYRHLVARGIMDAVGTVLGAKPWPQLN